MKHFIIKYIWNCGLVLGKLWQDYKYNDSFFSITISEMLEQNSSLLIACLS